jgi:hypothetical protein
MRLGVTRIPFDVPRLNLVNERFFLLYSARKALTTQMAAFDSAMLNQLPCLGVAWIAH